MSLSFCNFFICSKNGRPLGLMLLKYINRYREIGIKGLQLKTIDDKLWKY